MITEGIINVNKPMGMTSHDVVGRMRRVLGLRRVGHTGTLDPNATGVLPVCFGKSARIMDYLDMDIKKYRCTMQFGIETDTQDIWGEVLETFDTSGLTEEMILGAFDGLRGKIEQRPPMYSAVKVNGKRLYEYARDGREIETKKRLTFIKSLEVEDISLEGEQKTATFSVECTKGTYIRTICFDAGRKLGCGGTLTSLERTASGIFTVEDAVDLDDLMSMERDEVDKLIREPWEPLVSFGKIITHDPLSAAMFSNGWDMPPCYCSIVKAPKYEAEEFPLPIREEFRRAYCVFGNFGGGEEFIGVAFLDDQTGKFIADKIFNQKDVTQWKSMKKSAK